MWAEAARAPTVCQHVGINAGWKCVWGCRRLRWDWAPAAAASHLSVLSTVLGHDSEMLCLCLPLSPHCCAHRSTHSYRWPSLPWVSHPLFVNDLLWGATPSFHFSPEVCSTLTRLKKSWVKVYLNASQRDLCWLWTSTWSGAEQVEVERHGRNSTKTPKWGRKKNDEECGLKSITMVTAGKGGERWGELPVWTSGMCSAGFIEVTGLFQANHRFTSVYL